MRSEPGIIVPGLAYMALHVGSSKPSGSVQTAPTVVPAQPAEPSMKVTDDRSANALVQQLVSLLSAAPVEAYLSHSGLNAFDVSTLISA